MVIYIVILISWGSSVYTVYISARNSINLTTDLPVHELARVHPLKLAHKKDLETILLEWEILKWSKKKVKYKTELPNFTFRYYLFNSSKSANLQKQRNVIFPKETHSQLMTRVCCLFFFFISMSTIIHVNLSLRCLTSNLYYTLLRYYSLFSLSWVFENNQFCLSPTIQLASEEL